MRILVLSDIHANLTALQAVLAHAGAVDAVWCLGDVVGYGPDPNECIDCLAALPNLVCLQGNHDAAAIGQLPLGSFNAEARTSMEWLRENLAADSLAFLTGLEPLRLEHGTTLAHASPRQPVLEYLLDSYSALENFDFFDTPFCFVGHTHVPVLFTKHGVGVNLQVPENDAEFVLQERCIANPGSVGQPRDRDPRAAYALFDPETAVWQHLRVPYAIAEVQARMQAAGLPERHVSRLEGGW
ncbi:MAG: metallophosphoesterase family protein [Anaerolineales bacterium]|nr:metallophosphoesterase family protein [Anaerolineales bacterium]MBX3005422.1 metallophosphoesterase family protein [Anaerolineales bacterium]MCW5838805.1 metallophosphoesterase family protein [Anaerolineales bacterium]MCW5887863.1 metallophosphoesterase family protein [Anaerolineales bacterium]